MNRLAEPSPSAQPELAALLRTRALGRSLIRLDSVSSTNTHALDLGRQGAAHGTVVWAETQQAGKGRQGRRWHSPPGHNLYCSIVLNTAVPAGDYARWLSWVPLMAAVGTAQAIQACTGLHVALKWPNDLLVRSRKLGGILCESNGTPQQPLVVVGIGLNVNSPIESFPDDLRDLATSLLIETGVTHDRTALLASLLLEVERGLDAIVAGPPDQLVASYSRHCMTLGREVRVHLDGDTMIEGRATAIGQDGALLVAPRGTREATLIPVRAGDVLHVR